MSSTYPIQDLKPDYVLSVSYKEDSTESKDAYKRLIEKLHSSGFSTQVRAGTPALEELLVFIKLSSIKFRKEVEKDLVKSYEFGVTDKSDSPASRLRIIFQYLTTKTELGGAGISVSKDWKYLKNIVPISQALNKTLIESAKTHIHPGKLTTDNIKEQFGVRIALYFEFLKTYTTWLIILGVAGATTHYTRIKSTFLLTYAFVNLIWGVLFITYWGKRQQDLVHSWGVQNSHLVEENNAELIRLNEKSQTEAQILEGGKFKNTAGGRFVKQLAFVPIALGFTGVLVGFQLSCFVLEIFLSEIYDGPGQSLLKLIPTVAITVFVPILTIAYKIVTNFIITWENHDNFYSRENSVVAKSFVLTFLTSYIPLIITSFIYLPFAHFIEYHLGDIESSITSAVNNDYFFFKYLVQLKKQEDFKINQERLTAQFFYFVVTNQVIQVVLKYVLPIVIAKVVAIISAKKAPVVEDKPSEAAWLSKVRKVVSLAEYNVNDDFRAIVVQYGYLIIFGAIWPLAPFVNIAFNLITFKLDSWKLSSGQYFRPPIPVRVDTIHPWDQALFILTWIGSVISPVVTSFYHRGVSPPKSLGQFALDKASVNISSSVKFVIVIFAAEHAFFVVYFVASKVAKLFKSQDELKNDFVENDIKLRRDYYTQNEKPTITIEEDGEWSDFTAAGSLEVTSKIFSKEVKREKPSKATSTSATSNSAELLNKVKEKGDRVIADEKHEHYSTIDNNDHASGLKPGTKEKISEKVKNATHSL